MVHSGASASIPGGDDGKTERQRRLRFAEAFAAFAHGDQKYGDQPYSVHLSAVVAILQEWGCDDDTLIAGLLHDVLEDTFVSKRTVENLFGPTVGRLVDALTGVGENRSRRLANALGLIKAICPEAAVVKLADRIANVEAAAPDSDHMARYRREQPGFETVIRPLTSVQQWARLEAALGAVSTTSQPGTQAEAGSEHQ